jgi:predicted alpha/beta superfamily hydrolase
MHIHEIQSAYLGTTRRITVLLPRRRHGSRTGRFPVLYLNDGQNLFDPARAFAGNTWKVQDTVNRLVRRCLIPPLIVVGIDHGVARRGREYLPVEDRRHPAGGAPLGREYARFVTGEVMPFVEKRYPVARGASSTGFGGSSYGGVAALFTSLMFPGTFGRLLIESPSLYVGNQYLLRRARTATRWPGRIYLGVGTAESSRADESHETVMNVLKLETILRRAGLGPKRLAVAVHEGAGHTESAWAQRLPIALEFLFGKLS